MKNLILTISLLITATVFSQDIVGKWKTLDKNKAVKSIVQIYKNNNLYYGKIIVVTNKNGSICTTCVGKYKDKDVIGAVILEDLKKQDNVYDNGQITDPENGKTYSCYVKLEKPNKLKIRGFIGFSLLGRTEYWYKVSAQEEIEFTKKVNIKTQTK